MHTANNHTLQH